MRALVILIAYLLKLLFVDIKIKEYNFFNLIHQGTKYVQSKALLRVSDFSEKKMHEYKFKYLLSLCHREFINVRVAPLKHLYY